MTATLTVFADSPDQGQGLARDMPVRWALEEVGRPYAIRQVSFAEMKQPAHLALQPFGQIPVYQDGGRVLFESGAIVLHLAQHHPGLLPDAPDARARAVTWLFAALNTVEPVIVEYEAATFLTSDKPWHAEHLAILDARVRGRLGLLARRLGDAEWLDGGFSAGDLLMVSALRRVDGTLLPDAYPNLAAYVARGQARPAFQRAFAAQRALFVRRGDA